jgi:hypothetical protein
LVLGPESENLFSEKPPGALAQLLVGTEAVTEEVETNKQLGDVLIARVARLRPARSQRFRPLSLLKT